MNASRPEVIDGTPLELVDKITRENPNWGTDEWEVWWCKYGKNKWPHWKQLPVCAKCKCERRVNGN